LSPSEPSGQPPVTVIVPTHDRAALLPRLLAGLEAQQGVAGFDVIVVDDASTDDTRHVLTTFIESSSLSLRAIHLARNGGPATARNIGWRQSDAAAIAFLDDDCVPQPRWLASLLRSLEAVDIVQGRTLPDPAQRAGQGPFSRTLDIASEDGYYQTCNIAYRRDVLERMNGFHEQFRYPAGEDTDLAWRAKEAGATTAFNADALVHHDVSPSSLIAAVRDSWRWQSVALAVKRHPTLREAFASRHFWRPSHQYAMGVLAAGGILAGLPRSPYAWAGAAALAAPYVYFRGAKAPLPGVGPRRRWALVPAAFVVDAAEVTACVVGSVRYGALVI
jgi:glycosyltransferase involved in cell wall biosynthesis